MEKVHDVLKNDFAGGVLPSKRLFANVARWRLNAMRPEVERLEGGGMLAGSVMNLIDILCSVIILRMLGCEAISKHP